MTDGPFVHSRPMDYHLPPSTLDDNPSHPSGFPVTASAGVPMVHPSNHRPLTTAFQPPYQRLVGHLAHSSWLPSDCPDLHPDVISQQLPT
jgi:hypothetical protein